MKSHILVPVAVLALLAGAASMPAAASTSDVPGPPPRPFPDGATLRSLDAVNSSDIWAVGSKEKVSGYPHPLIKHWNGSVWRRTASYAGFAELLAVAAISANDAWAVGFHDFGSGGYSPLVLHWNGTNWREVQVPQTPRGGRLLTAVSYTSPTNVVIHGSTYQDEEGDFFSWVWNGRRWETGKGAVTRIVSIDAVAPDDAWGVGVNGGTYAAHWNGSRWKETTIPNAGTLRAVTAISRDDVWAAGHRYGSSNGFFEHWDGSSWTLVDDPHAGDRDVLTGISGSGSDDVWASGYTKDGFPHAFLQHWDGHRWTDVDNPIGRARSATMLDVVAISPTDAWAVGDLYPAVKVVMHWNGKKWQTYDRQHAS